MGLLSSKDRSFSIKNDEKLLFKIITLDKIMRCMSKAQKYQECAQKKGGVLLSTTITTKKLKWQCQEGHIFWMTANGVYRRGKWCKKCGNSNGERNIRYTLREFGITFDQEHRIDMIPSRRYDFYFEYKGRKFLIEFDGEQHFQYVRKYHRYKYKFYESQVIDRIKTYAAWNSGMTIIRIDYTQADNVRNHIIMAVNSPQVVYLSDPHLYGYIINVNITPEELRLFLG